MSPFSQFNFKGKKVLVRVDFNVPLNADLEVTDDTRIRETIPTITKIVEDGGIAILMSHMGRPKNGPEAKLSLRNVLESLNKLMDQKAKIFFANDCVGSHAKLTADMLNEGEILVLENLRFHKEEEAGDEAFAKKLASLGDMYVNDAFGTAHRAHASTAVIANYFDKQHKMFGLLMESEITNAEKLLASANKPFTAILGGAKVSDKILLIDKMMEKADNIIIGGGMSYTFIKAQGGKIGKSLFEEDRQDTAKEILEKAAKRGVKIYLPETSIAGNEFSNDAETKEVDSNDIPDGWMGLDIGAGARKNFADIIASSKTILWNGPMGVFEMPKFAAGTKAVAEAVANATDAGAYSLVGGGDSVAAVNQYHLGERVSFVSTGGGALLEYFEGKELPGIKAIKG